MSEEIDSSTDPANDKQETDPEHVVPTIRIRPVAEINTSEVSGSEAAPDTAPKRKNPSWLNAPVDEDTTAKKPKTNESVDTNCDSSDAAQPSTSAISSSPKSTEKVDTGEQSSTAACDQAQPSTSASSSSLKSPEKVDTGEQSSAAACDQVDVKTKIKDEPEEDEKPSESNNPQPAQQLATVKKEEVTSSIRDSCQFGIRCYRDEEDSPERSKKSWTTRDVKRMLKMVQARPVLWQVEHSDYKHRNNRPIALMEIEKEIGFPSLEIKRKLHNMRCTFRNQFKSIHGPIRTIKWKYYNSMKFMYASALRDDAVDTWNGSDNEEEIHCQEKTTAKKTPAKTILSIGEEIHTKELPSTSEPDSERKAPDKKELNLEPEKSNDCKDFGDYVAASIRNLPADLKNLAKRQISHLLFDMIIHADSRECNTNFDIGAMETNLFSPTATPVFGVCTRASNEIQEFQLKLHEF